VINKKTILLLAAIILAALSIYFLRNYAYGYPSVGGYTTCKPNVIDCGFDVGGTDKINHSNKGFPFPYRHIASTREIDNKYGALVYKDINYKDKYNFPLLALDFVTFAALWWLIFVGGEKVYKKYHANHRH
jgi:hypothetical protein